MITRDWKPGDRIDLELPLKPQRITAARPDRSPPAARWRCATVPLIYNVEAVDQDITKPLDPNAPLTTEWRGDLLGGVTVIKGKYADGTAMLAVPNFARANRNRGLPVEAGPLAADASLYMGPTAKKPAAHPPAADHEPELPPVSIVWLPKG